MPLTVDVEQLLCCLSFLIPTQIYIMLQYFSSSYIHHLCVLTISCAKWE